jgi:nicotinate-nucleotide adenylyltransferase
LASNFIRYPADSGSNGGCFMQIAVLGGTFNPIHWGHLLIAETALNQVQLDQIIWVPAYHPPHKFESDILLSFEHRYAMVQRAIAAHPNFVISAVEQSQPGNSYAVHTLQALQSAYPNCQWYWIIGLDAFRSLPRWYGYPFLVEQCCWLVAPRLNSNNSRARGNANPEAECLAVEKTLAAQSIKVRWQILEMPLVEVSSSLVRRYCQEQRSIRYLVPEAVREYISAQKLYQ